jgi:hypothetical protein
VPAWWFVVVDVDPVVGGELALAGSQIPTLWVRVSVGSWGCGRSGFMAWTNWLGPDLVTGALAQVGVRV